MATLNRKTLMSWEFVSFVLVTLVGWIAQIQGSFTGTEAVVLSAAAAGFTALARGFAKHDKDVKDWWATTEFFVALIGGGQATLAQLTGEISGETLTFIASGLAFALAISRGVAKNPLVATGLAVVEHTDNPPAVIEVPAAPSEPAPEAKK